MGAASYVVSREELRGYVRIIKDKFEIEWDIQ